MLPLIGWAHTQNDPWYTAKLELWHTENNNSYTYKNIDSDYESYHVHVHWFNIYFTENMARG